MSESIDYLGGKLYAQTTTLEEALNRSRPTAGKGFRELVSVPTGNRAVALTTAIRMIFGSESITIDYDMDPAIQRIAEEQGIVAEELPEVANFEMYARNPRK